MEENVLEKQASRQFINLKNGGIFNALQQCCLEAFGNSKEATPKANLETSTPKRVCPMH